MTAVCVDDDALMLAQTVSCCRAHRLLTDVQAFTSSPEALAWLKDHPADLALLDINMPDMNGLDATRIIKEVNHDMPIVALSAYAFEENIREAKEAGCDEFMAKPFRVEDLLDVVRKYVGE
jgi:CheY-like chemotaxis protein